MNPFAIFFELSRIQKSLPESANATDNDIPEDKIRFQQIFMIIPKSLTILRIIFNNKIAKPLELFT